MSEPPPPPVSPSTRPPARYDCSRLLQAAADLEAELSAAADGAAADFAFGHPAPPKLAALAVGDLLLLVAHTQRGCLLQEHAGGAAGEPLELCRFLPEPAAAQAHDGPPGRDERIACVTIVSLQDDHMLLEDDEDEEQDGAPPGAPLVVVEEPARSDQPGPATPHRSLLRGTMTEAARCRRRVAVVLGTTTSRLYAVEVEVDVLAVRVVRGDVPLRLCEVLPADAPELVEELRRHPRRTPFLPSGGIVALHRVVDRQQETLLWVVYGDGCLIRLHGAALFPSVWQRGAQQERSVDELLGRPAILRCQVQLSCLAEHELRGIAPLPVAVPSLAYPVGRARRTTRRWCNRGQDGQAEGSPTLAPSNKEDDARDDEDDDAEIVQALVFSNHPNVPMLVFYTSEVQFSMDSSDIPPPSLSPPDSDLLGALVGGTKALVGGVVGATLGIFGIGGRRGDEKLDVPETADESIDTSLDVSMSDSAAPLLGPFPSLWRTPVKLFACEELHDAPRKIEACSIAPDGQTAALTDNLGRVLLVDLSSKQVVRLFKGYRDASVQWFHSDPQTSSLSNRPAKPSLNLAIGSRQRRTVDIFRMRHGSCLCSIPTDRGSEVLSFSASPSSSQLSAFLLRSGIIGTASNFMEEIQLDSPCPTSPSRTAVPAHAPRSRNSPPRGSAALNLQHLRQLLSAEAVQLTTEDVVLALKSISSVTDLCTALDLLSEASLLEEKLDILGSSLQKLALEHSREILDRATDASTSRPLDPSVNTLALKIQYHTQLIEAYDMIFKFESVAGTRSNSSPAKIQNSWTEEASSWASLDKQLVFMSAPTTLFDKKARFSEFASACIYPVIVEGKGKKLRIYFSDSSRKRRDILGHVFKPLLGDFFSSRLVSSVFGSMGIQDDVPFLSKCFGEWALMLPVHDLRESGLSSPKSPLNRFIQDMAVQLLERGDLNDSPVLSDLFELCRTSEDLIRSFILCTLCRNALANVSAKKEKLTYGRILATGVVAPWETLLRKLRLCIVIATRLRHVRLVAPITVSNLEEDNLFSIYELVAYDELSISSRHEELCAIESACSGSSYSFNPSTAHGDDPTRIEQLLRVCKSSFKEGDGVASGDLQSEEVFGVLLLFLPHCNQPSLLAAHRTRLLIQAWYRNPSDFQPIEQAMVTLEYVSQSTGMGRIALGVAQDIWQAVICPIYRARLFGFHVVQEIDESLFSSMFSDHHWFHVLGRISIRLLQVMRFIPWTEESWSEIESKVAGSSLKSWPATRRDHVLKGLVDKSRRIDMSALDTQMSVICGLNVSDDVEKLFRCVPSLSDCFMPESLHGPMSGGSANNASVRIEFLEDAAFRIACSYSGPSMDSFALGEIEQLSRTWSIDLMQVNTWFLQFMYELGKDDLVDDLTTKSAGSFDVHSFIDTGVDLVCSRMHNFLSSNEMQKPEMRAILGMLDADLCEWIQQRARLAHTRIHDPMWDVSLNQTHLLTLRLLNLSTISGVDSVLRVKIHSLTVSCGVLASAIDTKNP